MADKKISELTELTTPDGTEELVVNDSGVSKKVQIDNLLAGGTISNFTSTGIDDNATSTAITIDASENVGIGIASPTEKLHIVVPGSTTTNVTGIKISNDQDLSGENVGISFGSTSWGDGATIYAKDLASDGKADLCFGVRISGAPTEKARITANGLTFNGDTAAANALDDYETGTWDAAFLTGSGSITVNPSYDLGYYTKIGNTVFVSIHIRASSVSSPTGSLWITGLPYSSLSGAKHRTAFSISPNYGLSFPSGSIPNAFLTDSSSQLGVFGFTGGSVINAASYISSGSELYISGTYIAA